MSASDHSQHVHHPTTTGATCNGSDSGSPQSLPPEYAAAVEALPQANERMREGMSLEPSGAADIDFAAGMLAHHKARLIWRTWSSDSVAIQRCAA